MGGLEIYLFWMTSNGKKNWKNYFNKNKKKFFN
jgi:hypothetical protein